MNLEDQVCPLSASKRLWELGVRGRSVFWWRNDYPNNHDKYPDVWNIIPDSDYPYTGPHCASVFDGEYHLLPAFTVAELGQMLTDDIRSYRFEDSWQIYYPSDSGMALFISEDCDTEVQIRAAFLIWNLESGLITAEEVNERLKGG